MRSSMCASNAADVPPCGSIESPRKHTSSMVPSKCSSWKLQLKTEVPNLIDSSQPNDMTRLLAANLKAAIASPAIVTSPRISLLWRAQAAGTPWPGHSTSSTSWMLAETVDEATPRASCACRSPRSSADSACQRPCSSRRGSRPTIGEQPGRGDGSSSSDSDSSSALSSSTRAFSSFTWSFSSGSFAASPSTARARLRAVETCFAFSSTAAACARPASASFLFARSSFLVSITTRT